MIVDVLKQSQNLWLNTAAQSSSIVDIEAFQPQEHQLQHSTTISDGKLDFFERAFSAAGAAVFSAILVNPLDVAKVPVLCMLYSFNSCISHLVTENPVTGGYLIYISVIGAIISKRCNL